MSERPHWSRTVPGETRAHVPRPQSLRLILKPETIIHAGFNDMDSAVG